MIYVNLFRNRGIYEKILESELVLIYFVYLFNTESPLTHCNSIVYDRIEIVLRVLFSLIKKIFITKTKLMCRIHGETLSF